MFSIPQQVIAVLEGLFMFAGAFFVLFWFALVLWTFQDIRRRTNDWLVRILAVLMVLVFHLVGLFVYLIVRPQETLATKTALSLEEEALMQGMDEKLVCPSCHKSAQPDFAVCPYCGERLKHACENCGKLLSLSWTVCPYCETPVQRPEELPALAPLEDEPVAGNRITA